MKNGFKQGEESKHRRRDGLGKKPFLLPDGNWVEGTEPSPKLSQVHSMRSFVAK